MGGLMSGGVHFTSSPILLSTSPSACKSTHNMTLSSEKSFCQFNNICFPRALINLWRVFTFTLPIFNPKDSAVSPGKLFFTCLCSEQFGFIQ